MTRTDLPVGLAAEDRAGSHFRRFTKVLVDIDKTASAQPALQLAASLARRSGARLRVIDAARRAEAGSADQNQLLAYQLREEVSPYDVVVREVQRFGHDLVIRAQDRDSVACARRAIAINELLFRHCPCPVWSVGLRSTVYNPRILAAVKPSRADPGIEALNRQVLDLACSIHGLLGGEITVFSAWRLPAEEKLCRYATDVDLKACLQETEERSAFELAANVDRFGGRAAVLRTELKQGCSGRAGTVVCCKPRDRHRHYRGAQADRSRTPAFRRHCRTSSPLDALLGDRG